MLEANTKVLDESHGRTLIYLPLPHSGGPAPAVPRMVLPGVGAELQTPADDSGAGTTPAPSAPASATSSTPGAQS